MSENPIFSVNLILGFVSFSTRITHNGLNYSDKLMKTSCPKLHKIHHCFCFMFITEFHTRVWNCLRSNLVDLCGNIPLKLISMERSYWEENEVYLVEIVFSSYFSVFSFLSVIAMNIVWNFHATLIFPLQVIFYFSMFVFVLLYERSKEL